MDERNPRRRYGPDGGRHSRPPRRPAPKRGQPPLRRRREPLQDNYYYEEPPRAKGGRSQPPESFEDISSYSSPGRRRADQMRPARRPKRPGGGRRTVKAVLLLFVLAVVGGGIYVFGFMLSGLKMVNLTKDKAALGIGGDVYLDPEVKNIAMFGLDARDGENVGRSDALMVLTIDKKHHKLKLTSILRDSQVYIDGYGYDKITHAYAYGGPELAIKTLNQNYHLDIQDYVTVNFTKMAQIVDAFGGVEMDLTGAEKGQINQNLWDLSMEAQRQKDEDMANGAYKEGGYPEIQNSDFLLNAGGTVDWANGEYFEDGRHLLNGNQAVAFARIRYLEGGDDVRAGRQQLVLQGLITQLKGKSKLMYPALVHDVVPMCETSLDYLGMMGLAPFVLTDFTMETLTIPGAEENAYGDYNDSGAWVYMYDVEAAAGHISRFIYEEASPYAW